MFAVEHTAVRYTKKGKVLYFLNQLMQDVLLPVEQELILLHCGVGEDAPLSFSQLAGRLELSSSKEAARRYLQAVEKTRAAIPGSELAFWVASYEPKTL